MDKLSFKEKTLTADFKLKTTAKIISYNIKANDSEIIRLDVSDEGQELLADMPIDTKNCHELVWDEQFVKEINANNSNIFIVSLEDGKYRIQTVSSASYFFSSEDELAFANDEFGFNFDHGSFDTKEDLLTFGLKSKVNFNFADNMHCPGEYYFYKSTKGRSLNENELVVVPQLGVIRNYTISKKLNRNLREVELQSVNDMPLSTFLNQLCDKTTVVEEKAEDILVAKSGDKIVKETVTISTEVVEEVLNTNTNTVNDAATVDDAATSTKPTATLDEMKKPMISCPHIYRNADTGFYYNKDTGLPANSECGGIVYQQGVMQNSDYQSTTATTELVSNAQIESTEKNIDAEFISKGEQIVIAKETIVKSDELGKIVIVEPMKKVIVAESTPKIIYKQPKVDYKQNAAILIDPSIEPQDSKIIIPNNNNNNNNNNNQIALNQDCTVAPRTGYHLVKKGETLYKLSNMYKVSIEDLMQWNGLSNSEISVCAHLRVQTETSVTQSTTIIPANDFVSKGGKVNTTIDASPAKKQYHYISQGETLYAISKKYQVSVESIKSLNNLNDNYLKPGWRLIVPNRTEQFKSNKDAKLKQTIPSANYTPQGGSSMKIPNSSENLLNNYQNQHIYHTVAQNESINDIALKYGTSINSIKALNEMSEGEVLIPFQKIKVR